MAYLSSCCNPPVLSSLTLGVSKYHNRTSCPSWLTFSIPHPHCASFFPSSFSISLSSPMGRDNIFNRTKEMLAGTENEDRQLDGHGLEIIMHVFTYNTVCTSFSLCPREGWYISLTLWSSSSSSFVLVSNLTTAVTTVTKHYSQISVFGSFSFLCLALSVSLLLLFSCFTLSVPTRLCGQSPAVDYQSVDLQRAAKASRTNMREYPNDWLGGCGPWKQASISAWARLGPQVCPWTILASNSDTL